MMTSTAEDDNFSARAILSNPAASSTNPLIEEGEDLNKSSSPIDALKAEQKHLPEMFYGLCHKQKYCWSRITCGKFKNRTHCFQCGIFTLMLTALFVSIIVPLMIYKLADDTINEEVVVDSEDASGYEMWQTNAEGEGADHVQIFYNLYLFNVQNAEEILQGAQPELQEIGPYAFKEFYNKFDIKWTDDGDTVTYNTQKYYLFDAEKTGSGLSLDDKLLMPNPSAIGFEYFFSMIPETATDMLDAQIKQIVTDGEDSMDDLVDGLIDTVDSLPLVPQILKDDIDARLMSLRTDLDGLFERLYAFTDQSTPATLLLKTLLCGTPAGASPFWEIGPYEAWFGWLNDPLLLEVQKMLDLIAEQTGEVIPWTAAVPGASTNWTSEAETRRRRAPDTFKTGKENARQVGQYVKYENMDILWTCVAPMNSQDPAKYVEGEQFPACEHFNSDWEPEEAEEKGWAVPFATEYARRIEGTDASMFGRPVASDRLQVYISDIYRSAYLTHKSDEKWNGVSLRRYSLQSKDLESSIDNPENAQYYAFGPSGMENTTAAVGIPVFVSFPHFLFGDPSLVAAVRGLDPREEIHGVYLDVEPQTGILARVGKRLQVNYQLKSQYLPSTQPDSLDLAHNICGQIDGLVEVLAQLGVNTSVSSLSCNSTIITSLFTCWNQPTDWRVQGDEDGNGDGIFFPYGWVDEGMALPNDDADTINDDLISLDNVAEAVRFWSLVVAGGCFLMLAFLQYNSCMDREYRLKKYGSPTPLLDFFFATDSDADEADLDKQRLLREGLLHADADGDDAASHGAQADVSSENIAVHNSNRSIDGETVPQQEPQLEGIYSSPGYRPASGSQQGDSWTEERPPQTQQQLL